ncbi:hypothetical protein IMCC14465_05270 [alpha proteobacterium IMCC14465]|uniref:Histidinol-phosphatase n=1 Tax=alpha proteobacterium IMCC14465 TaxID=1220535 RepID=J9DJ64_9PROT|nr:hypothetical protein IMCC14465_05270 [alpha proteobacterium IMCC14465]
MMPQIDKEMSKDALFTFANELADAAAQITLPLFRQPLDVSSKLEDGFDPVTKADKDTEQKLRDIIEARFPAHAILGEEFGFKSGTAYQWTLDPIDGTRAYISGMPSWGTLVALSKITEDGSLTPLMGLADQPYIKERYLGWISEDVTEASLFSHGADKKNMSTRQCAAIGDAVLATTDSNLFVNTPTENLWLKISTQTRLNRYGGDWYNYMLLADGHVDIVLEQGLQAYDIQALIPIISAAGGKVTDWQGNDPMLGGQVLACGDASLHAQIIELLNA